MANQRWSFGTEQMAGPLVKTGPVGPIGDLIRTALLGHTLLTLRWITILTLLGVTLIWPMSARAPLETWHLVAAFAVYSIVMQTLLRSLSPHDWSTVLALMDLIVVGILYALGGALNGPIIALAVLSATMTSVFMAAPVTIAYTLGLGLSITAASFTLPGWTGSQADIQFLGGQLIILAIAGIGMRLLTARVEAEQRQASQEAMWAARIAERDRARTDFIATVSHELRTPLTATHAGLALLGASSGERLSLDERELLANSRRNVDRLGRLIDDLLAMNQLEAGTLRLDVEPVDLVEIASAAAAAIQPLMTARGQHLQLDLPAPLRLMGDRRRLEQILLNLLSNAQRHTANGSTIRITGASAPGWTMIEVADDGPAVAAADLDRLFEVGAIRPTNMGTGLGLVIVDRLVRLHGGRTSAALVPTGGLSLTVELPQTPPRAVA
jgi:signal transduction histidine kinase